MSIRTIKVQHQNGTTETISFSGTKNKLALRANTNGIYQTTIQPLENGSSGIILDATGSLDIVDRVTAIIRLQHQPLLSLNGVAPASDGTFFLHGSECDSVVPDKNKPNQMNVVDMCPACSTCDAIVLLSSQIEYYKTYFNAIKDINLYTKQVLISRKQYMESKRMDLSSTACSSVETRRVPAPSGWDFQQLFQQYATTVQMWNYVVSQNNASTQIRTAPEDPTGFIVETKRAVPSCGNNSQIGCSVQIQAIESSQMNILSVYVVPQAVEFKPLRQSGALPSLVVTHNTATKKTVTLPMTSIPVAGTYLLSMKFLPFVYTVLRDDKGNQFDLKHFTWTPIIQEGRAGQSDIAVSQKVLNNLTKQQIVINNPNQDQYQEAKAYPSQSNSSKNTWQIKVKWTVKDNQANKTSTYNESYYFQTNGVREYFDGVFMNDDLASYKT